METSRIHTNVKWMLCTAWVILYLQYINPLIVGDWWVHNFHWKIDSFSNSNVKGLNPFHHQPFCSADFNWIPLEFIHGRISRSIGYAPITCVCVSFSINFNMYIIAVRLMYDPGPNLKKVHLLSDDSDYQFIGHKWLSITFEWKLRYAVHMITAGRQIQARDIFCLLWFGNKRRENLNFSIFRCVFVYVYAVNYWLKCNHYYRFKKKFTIAQTLLWYLCIPQQSIRLVNFFNYNSLVLDVNKMHINR